MSMQRAALKKRWRGVVLELVYDGHRKQESRMDDLALWGFMRDLGQDVGQMDVRTLLQELAEMKYLRIRQDKNDLTNETCISEIEITRGGIVLVEKEDKDPLVRVL
jgi:hypothetical protein